MSNMGHCIRQIIFSKCLSDHGQQPQFKGAAEANRVVRRARAVLEVDLTGSCQGIVWWETVESSQLCKILISILMKMHIFRDASTLMKLLIVKHVSV